MGKVSPSRRKFEIRKKQKRRRKIKKLEEKLRKAKTEREKEKIFKKIERVSLCYPTEKIERIKDK